LQAFPQAAPFVDMLVAARIAPWVYVAIELGLADLLADDPRTVEELAVATSTHAPSLARLLRGLAAIDVVRQAADGRLELTPTGEVLRRDGPELIRAMFRSLCDDATWRSLGDLLASVRTGEPAVDRIYGKPVFEVMRDTGADQTYEASFRNRMPVVARALLEVYDFSRFQCVVDVGGSTGALLTAILRSNPNTRGILFDLPHVIARAEPLLAQDGVLDRCSMQGGSFFESVPRGGDAYVLTNVIHDWGDPQATAILRSCRAAVPAAGVLLLLEEVVPEEIGFESGPVARGRAILDMTMLMFTQGGRERTAREYSALLAETGFQMTRVVPTTAPVSIIEARPA
jgi:hypothetical protein